MTPDETMRQMEKLSSESDKHTLREPFLFMAMIGVWRTLVEIQRLLIEKKEVGK